MIYNTKTRKYGRKNKRNMRGGDGESWMVTKILILLAAIAMIFVFAFGNIVQGGGTAKPR